MTRQFPSKRLKRQLTRSRKHKPRRWLSSAAIHAEIRREMVALDSEAICAMLNSLGGPTGFLALPEGTQVDIIHPVGCSYALLGSDHIEFIVDSPGGSFGELKRIVDESRAEISKLILGESMTTNPVGDGRRR